MVFIAGKPRSYEEPITRMTSLIGARLARDHPQRRCQTPPLPKKTARNRLHDIFFMPLALIALDDESALLFPETGFSDAAERRTWSGYTP
ncbi:hypothetical protein SAMN05660489_04417 [Pseudomonas sp. LAMO17WK12:I10]|uniref:hypothetical protein n=1 Tax=unclassified Pseudomonas TaxID=196821 RepID=UPI000BDB1FC7|nr:MULTISPECIES: hypothetical protein [unclassified Pseudomonas]PXX60147.1 hypothetical protein H160_04593 [Pseudomonas sp. LAMO17WK12:I9]SNY45900.1 hypothetical protein SAMN05660489_04417 [Pseudomonas sp. LAMO17WK12:I10]